eukprot:COSAG04_NODE_21068_length_380_cov_1.277580_1_plen_80_part_10
MSSKKAAKKLKKKLKNKKTQVGDTPEDLLAAAQDGDCGTIGGLLDRGMDVNALAETGQKNPVTGQPMRWTALYVSVWHKQ